MSHASNDYTDHINSGHYELPITHITVQSSDTEKLLRAIETVQAHGLKVVGAETYRKLQSN